MPAGSEVLARYLAREGRLLDRLGGDFTSPSAAFETARAISPRVAHRDALARTLRAMTDAFGADASTLANIDALEDDDTFVVATGQQPGFATGPLYTLLKAASAIALARELTARTPLRFVPIFWIASDDHDLAEIEGCHVLTDDAELRRVRAPLGPLGSPSSRLVVDDGVRAAFDEFVSAIPNGPFRTPFVEAAAPAPGEPWSAWFGRTLRTLFPRSGLVLFEPCRAPDLVLPVLEAELAAPARMTAALNAGARSLADLGLDAPLPTDAPSTLFRTDDGRRRRFDPAVDDAGEIRRIAANDPTSLSADAALRPILQSRVLPTAAVVGGPGELAYWLQLREAFEGLDTPRPVFHVRLHATFVEPRVRRALAALNLSDEDLFLDEDVLRAKVELPDPERVVALQSESDGVYAALERFVIQLDGFGGPVPKTLRELKRSFRASLDKVLRQALEQERERLGVSARRVSLVARSGRPFSKPQDRVLNGVPFVARAGLDLFSRLADALDPFDSRHRIIHLENEGATHG